jgi:hypothetical protein
MHMNITTLWVAPLATQSSSITATFLHWKRRIARAFSGNIQHYHAEAIEYQGNYYYRALGVTVEATPHEYTRVIQNPKLYYFSAALKLHQRIARAKVLGLGLHWPDQPAAPLGAIEPGERS